MRRLQEYAAALAIAPRGSDLRTRLAQSLPLFSRALFFEVHEVLEPSWQRASGLERILVQGVIQAAVAWHPARQRRAPARLAAAAAEKLADVPSPRQGFAVAEVEENSRSLAERLAADAAGADRTALRAHGRRRCADAAAALRRPSRRRRG